MLVVWVRRFCVGNVIVVLVFGFWFGVNVIGESWYFISYFRNRVCGVLVCCNCCI